MRRVDILKLQLKQNRGRFFTVEFTPDAGNAPRKMNLKISDLLHVSEGIIYFTAYVPSARKHRFFSIDTKTGDCTYLAADKSKIAMSGFKA